MKHTLHVVIVGATSAIAAQCARVWLEAEPVDLTLVGRDDARLASLAADLAVRSPASTIRPVRGEFADPRGIRTTVDAIAERGRIDIVLIAHGVLPDQRTCQHDLQACHDALSVNGTSPVLFAEAFAGHLAKADRGTIALIGSVAGDRGRRSNYVYGAAKGMLDRYAQGLRHRFARTGVTVVLIKPGPTDTPMTAHLKDAGARLASVEDVARRVVRGIEAGHATVYAPGRWRLIMAVIRHLPEPIFARLNI